jgi:superfamily II DNA or RNA helicase
VAPFRLNAGRVVDPVDRPRVAAARDLLLPEVLTSPLPKRSELTPAVMDAGGALRPALPRLPVLQIPVDRLEGPAILPLAARVDDPEGISRPLEDVDAGSFEGGELSAWPEVPATGPLDIAQFQHIYEPTLLEWFRPYLEPAQGAAGATPIADFPNSLRAYQVEASQALLEHEAFLLADDPGTGKTAAACAALQALFHQDRARRALVVCQAGNLRHWWAQLSAWAPGLLISLTTGESAAEVNAWSVRAHVYLADYRSLADAIEDGDLGEGQRSFDAVVLDDVESVRRRDSRPLEALRQLHIARRWGLMGSLPKTTAGWLEIFSLLSPDRFGGRSDLTLPDLRRALKPFTLRRTKAELAGQLPSQTRVEVWVGLDPAQVQLYEQELAEERHRLAKLGSAVTYSHIASATARLKQACNFVPESLDGPKVRVLVNLVEEISGGGNKVIVFSHFRERGLDPLAQVLDPYGIVRLESTMPEDEHRRALDAFRTDASRHVLLADPDVRPAGGPVTEASYGVHFDHDWNPAIRRRAERRFLAESAPTGAVTIYEVWVAGSFEAELYRLLKQRHILPSGLAQDTRPADLEGRLRLDEWMKEILQVPELGATPRLAPPVPTGTGRLPGTEMLRRHVLEIPPRELLAFVGQLIQAWGFPQAEALRGPDESGGDLLAWRETDIGLERLVVRCIRASKDVGVGEGRALLAEMHSHDDCIGTYLITTSDFTSACKKLADESKGRLALVTGVELYRHLHMLGAMA